MARKTVHVCDRCETEYQTDRMFTLLKVWPNMGRGTEIRRDVELCPDCVGDFWSEFMPNDNRHA